MNITPYFPSLIIKFSNYIGSESMKCILVNNEYCMVLEHPAFGAILCYDCPKSGMALLPGFVKLFLREMLFFCESAL